MNRRVKYGLEQGSRFRAYRLPTARPSLGHRIVDQITVYEQTPPGKIVGSDQGDPVWEPDGFEIFERFDVRHAVEVLGVKEIWFWGGGLSRYPCFDPALHHPRDFRGGSESNMSSPLTGDISNNNRDPSDLPVYDRTCIVYGCKFRRSQAEALHDHGHQLESQFTWVNDRQDGNSDLFWKKWRGQDAFGKRVTGRCGDTHCPPNTVADCDYLNPALVWSDIEDWGPDHGGVQKLTNVDTWGNLVFARPDDLTDFSQRVETQYYTYWMMSMPGYSNGLVDGPEQITNWWQFVGDWDGALAAGRGLHAPPPSGAPVETPPPPGGSHPLRSPESGARRRDPPTLAAGPGPGGGAGLRFRGATCPVAPVRLGARRGMEPDMGRPGQRRASRGRRCLSSARNGRRAERIPLGLPHPVAASRSVAGAIPQTRSQ